MCSRLIFTIAFSLFLAVCSLHLHAQNDCNFNGIPDTEELNSDADSTIHACDNCALVSNAGQLDTDGDGFGNQCDADLDNTAFVNFGDLALFKTAFNSADPHADFDGSGFVNFGDLAIFKSLFNKAPGPGVYVPTEKAVWDEFNWDEAVWQ